MANATPTVRWVAVAAGVVVALALSLGVTPLCFVLAFPMVVGAAIERRFGVAGRVLICVGALVIVSPCAVYLGFVAVSTIPLVRRYHDLGILTMFVLSVLSVFLAGACDVMLVVDTIRMRRIPDEN
ncbi:MAG TPA: hypothetical protein VMF66_11435 [Candidatus Acidoferrum sp.]|nr:hypothetical protein [Candidatus Acidoferrum sp.]